MTPREIMIANLAAAVIMNDDPELTDYFALDNYDRAALVRDYRDDFASSEFAMLADAKITDNLVNMITDVLDAILAS